MICSRKPADARATPPLQVASLRTGGLDVKPQSQGDLCESPWPLIVATGRMTHPHKHADLILFSKPFFFFFFFLWFSPGQVMLPAQRLGLGSRGGWRQRWPGRSGVGEQVEVALLTDKSTDVKACQCLPQQEMQVE